MSLFPVEFEHSLAFENDVQLLLATRALVVLLNKRLACAARDEEVNAEGVDPKRMLERVPHCVVRIAVWDDRHLSNRLHRPTRHGASLGVERDEPGPRVTVSKTGAARVARPAALRELEIER